MALPSVAKQVKQTLILRDQAERDMARYYRTVGWLARNVHGWDLRSGSELPRQSDLWVISVLKENRGEWRKVGTISDRKPKIDAVDESALSEGRPVFVIVIAF